MEYPEPVVRQALASMLIEVGPDAPTLCEGWTSSDIAIHLVLIERHPESWLGIPISNRIGATRGYFDGLVDRERERPWPDLVDRVSSGPTRGPLGSAAFRNRMMFREYAVHGEDVRRANELPVVDLGPAVREKTWDKAKFFARFVHTSPSHGLEIATPDGRVHRVREGSPSARITGEPIELLLYEFGRRPSAVTVELSGDPEAVDGLSVRAGGAEAMPRTR